MPRIASTSSRGLTRIGLKRIVAIPTPRDFIEEVSDQGIAVPTAAGMSITSDVSRFRSTSLAGTGGAGTKIVFPINLTVPFTVECQMYATLIPMVFSTRAPWAVTTNSDGTGNFVRFVRLNNPQVEDQQAQYAFGNAKQFLNTWVHLALVINANTFDLFFDGVLARSTSWITPKSTFSSIVIGGGIATGGFIGNLDDIRVSSGQRYTTNFSPPTSGLTVDGTTLALFRTNPQP